MTHQLPPHLVPPRARTDAQQHKRDGSQPEIAMQNILKAVSEGHRTAAELSAITGLSMRSVRRFTLELRSRRALEVYLNKTASFYLYGLPSKHEYPSFRLGTNYRWHASGTKPDQCQRLVK